MPRRPVRRPRPALRRGSPSVAHEQSQAAEIEGQQRIATLTPSAPREQATSELLPPIFPNLGQTREHALIVVLPAGSNHRRDVSPKSPVAQGYSTTNSSQLNPAELASLDLLITVAQQRGRQLDEVVKRTEEHADAMVDVHEAMWEARHGGLVITEHDREILGRMRELASELELTPTLSQRVEMRGRMLSGQ